MSSLIALRRALRVMCLAAALLCLATEAAVVLNAERMLACCRLGMPGPALDAAVVLGGPMDPDGEMSWATRRRVIAGVRLLERGETRRLILSGGHARPELARRWGLRNPAEAMAELALRLGVPPEALTLETEARTTVENIDFAMRIAADRGWTRIGLVSDAWHLPRAMALAVWRGHDGLRPVAVDIRPWQWTRDTPALYLREAGAWWFALARVLGLASETDPAPG